MRTSSLRITKVGKLRLAEPSPYVTHAPIAGLPARIEPVFIWQTEPTWFRPSAVQDRTTASLSACLATCGYQSETHSPLSPCRAHLRWEGIRVLCDVPGIAVRGLS